MDIPSSEFGKFSSPFSVLSSTTRLYPWPSSVQGFLLTSDKINHSMFLLLANSLKIYQDIMCVEDCKSVQADIDSVKEWCVENCMEINI
jgi:hypothetical protein